MSAHEHEERLTRTSARFWRWGRQDPKDEPQGASTDYLTSVPRRVVTMITPLLALEP